jgi:hypothetical protein
MQKKPCKKNCWTYLRKLFKILLLVGQLSPKFASGGWSCAVFSCIAISMNYEAFSFFLDRSTWTMMQNSTMNYEAN